MYKIHPNTFNVQNDYAPITIQLDDNLILEVNPISLIVSSTVITFIHKVDPEYRTFLRKFNFHHRQLSPQEKINKMQLLCEFQDAT